MTSAYRTNLYALQNSEWDHIRELAAAISAAYPAVGRTL
jgi:hypothetical protein